MPGPSLADKKKRCIMKCEVIYKCYCSLFVIFNFENFKQASLFVLLINKLIHKKPGCSYTIKNQIDLFLKSLVMT